MSTPPATPPTPAAPRPRRAPKPLPSALNVITGTLGLFLVILTLLALQVRSGKDPSLAQSPASSSGTTGSSSSAAATRTAVTKSS